MKTLKLCMVMIVSILMHISCDTTKPISDVRPTGEGKIAITMNGRDLVLGVQGSEQITVILDNWGRRVIDGTYFDYHTFKFPHGRSKSVEIYGDITKLVINGKGLIELDISENPTIKYLDCSYNTLQSLELSEISSLEFVNISFNSLSSTELNRIFQNLPHSSSNNKIIFNNNPGNFNSNPSIAQTKGWTVENHEIIPSVKIARAKENLPEEVVGVSRRIRPLIEYYIAGVGEVTIIASRGESETLYFDDISDFNMVDDDLIGGENNVFFRNNLHRFKTFITDALSYQIFGHVTHIYLPRGNPVGYLDVTNCPALEYLYINHTYLRELDLSQNPNLKYLTLKSMRFFNLDVSNNLLLEYLDYTGHPMDDDLIIELDLSNNLLLRKLGLFYSHVANLDVSNNRLLEMLNFMGNKASTLDLSNNHILNYVDISSNNFSGEGLDNTFHSLHGNQIEKIIYIDFNPGSTDCDTTIATQKGWTVRR